MIIINKYHCIIDLLADTELNDEQSDYVDTVKNSSNVLLDLLNDISKATSFKRRDMFIHKTFKSHGVKCKQRIETF